MIRTALAATVALTTALGAAAAPISPADAADMLTGYGSEFADITWLDEKTATIDGKMSEYFYTVRMMNCSAVRVCETVMIFATFEMGGAPGLESYLRTNEYNDSYPFGRAFVLDPEDEDTHILGVDYAIDVSGGHTFTGLDMDKFMAILSSYVDHMASEGEE